jgi:hypothetical protein
MQNAKLFIFFLSLTISNQASCAEALPTVGELATIQAETMLIKARIKQEEAKNDLALKHSKGGAEDGTLPVVKSIFGTENHMVATLIYPGNMQVEAVVGELIPGGYKINKIHQTANKVELIKGKEKFTIGFSAIVPLANQKNLYSPVGPSGMNVPNIHR